MGFMGDALRDLHGDLTPEELGIFEGDDDYAEAYAAYRRSHVRQPWWKRWLRRTVD